MWHEQFDEGSRATLFSEFMVRYKMRSAVSRDSAERSVAKGTNY